MLLPLLLAMATPADLVGVYDGHQMEIAAGLELRADGRFRYGLAYGALDEEAEGSWTVEGDHVLLTTEPAVVPARFTLSEQKPAASGAVEVAIVDTKGRTLPNIDIAVTYAEGDPDIVQSREEPVDIPFDAARPPRAILLAVPVFDVESDPFPIDAAKGTGFTFRFEPNGLGTADFQRTPLAIEKGALVLPRFDRTLRFERR
jgi:hypothetical protein